MSEKRTQNAADWDQFFRRYADPCPRALRISSTHFLHAF
jgi:hypothetical protein